MSFVKGRKRCTLFLLVVTASIYQLVKQFLVADSVIKQYKHSEIQYTKEGIHWPDHLSAKYKNTTTSSSNSNNTLRYGWPEANSINASEIPKSDPSALMTSTDDLSGLPTNQLHASLKNTPDSNSNSNNTLQYLSRETGTNNSSMPHNSDLPVNPENAPNNKSIPSTAALTLPSSSSSSLSSGCRVGSSGKWVLDWDYANRSNYPNGGGYSTWHYATKKFKPGASPSEPHFRRATAWRWEDDCLKQPMPEISLTKLCEVCYDLNVTRFLIIGDSISMEFEQSLYSLLGKPVNTYWGFESRLKIKKFGCSFTRAIDTNLPDITNNSSTATASKNITINFKIKMLYDRRSPLPELLALKHKDKKIRNFIKENPQKTVIVANAGQWLKDMTEFRLGFDSLYSWIQSWDSEKVIAFYRETIPGHPGCLPFLPPVKKADRVKAIEAFDFSQFPTVDPHATYDEYAISFAHERAKNVNASYNYHLFEQYNAYAYERIMNDTHRRRQEGEVRNPATDDREHKKDGLYAAGGVPLVRWLNIYNSTVLRRDGHVGFGDCAHYYLPGPTDWWAHFLYKALLDLRNS